MSETETTGELPAAAPAPSPTPPPKPETAPAPAPVKQKRSSWPVFFGLGFIILAAGEAYLWYQQRAAQAGSTQLAVLASQVSDLQGNVAELRTEAAKAAPSADSVTAQADLAQKLAGLSAQLGAVQAQAAADHGAISTLQANSTDLGKLTQRIALLNALGTARMALDAGQPLGQIPNAPPALAKFATIAPPTEAQLRETFPGAAKAAEEASLSANGKTGFWAGVKLRLEGFLTVSEGTRVLFGPPAAGTLAQAQQDLNAGDLAGAVAALQTLSTPTQAALGSWLTQAQNLLAARAALISLAQAA